MSVLILSKRYGYSNALRNLWECSNLLLELLEKLVFKVLNVSLRFSGRKQLQEHTEITPMNFFTNCKVAKYSFLILCKKPVCPSQLSIGEKYNKLDMIKTDDSHPLCGI